ncbi:MAG: aldehyde ferredoxin oxidoreductase family protein [Chloroflexi bacterium]|nr:aldehyde ferredoxin oxidoreductase family protein [Chloroflexota bacterium]
MPNGYTGNILRVDLSQGTTTVEHPDETFYRRYFGGAGFVAYYLLKELSKGIDPLGPENRLIFAAGPITGSPIAGSGRHTVGAKSPRSGALAKAEAGGFWGAELKRSGFDAIVIQGKARKPVYLWIHDGEAEIRDATHLWGKDTRDAQEAIRQELGDRLIRVAQIGPGGERMVRFASVVNDLKDSASRPGMGAVMGSKNLKAVAVRGLKSVPNAEPAKVRALTKWLAENYMQLARGFHDWGTGAGMDQYMAEGNLPIRNFRDGEFEDWAKTTAQALKNTGIRIGMENCWACPLRCKKVVKSEQPYAVDPAYGGPEYETLGSFGSTCGVSDLKAICKANELCNAYSIDTISAGVTIAFAMECFEKGLLTLEDTDGIDLRFGNAKAMLEVLEKIGKREGIGNLLAEGSAIAAKKIGHGAEQLAMHVKGVEIPMHEPRLKQGMGLIYATNAYGADHMVGVHDTFFKSQGPPLELAKSLGILEPIPVDDLGPQKVFLAKTMHLWRHFLDSVVMCTFLPYDYRQMAEIVEAVTGWNTSVLECLRVGERVVTMARTFNMREGITSADDRLPARCFTPTTSGPLSNTAINPKELDKAIHTFYEMMGWDRKTGNPTSDKLKELDVGWVLEKL